MGSHNKHERSTQNDMGRIKNSTVTYLFMSLALIIWFYVLRNELFWFHIEIPPILLIFFQSILSIIVFYTFGLFLYSIFFYKVLHFIIVKIFNLWGLYILVKAVIWAFLMFIAGMVIIFFLNPALSFLLNIFLFLIYSIPPILIALIIKNIFSPLKKINFDQK